MSFKFHTDQDALKRLAYGIYAAVALRQFGGYDSAMHDNVRSVTGMGGFVPESGNDAAHAIDGAWQELKVSEGLSDEGLFNAIQVLLGDVPDYPEEKEYDEAHDSVSIEPPDHIDEGRLINGALDRIKLMPQMKLETFLMELLSASRHGILDGDLKAAVAKEVGIDDLFSEDEAREYAVDTLEMIDEQDYDWHEIARENDWCHMDDIDWQELATDDGWVQYPGDIVQNAVDNGAVVWESDVLCVAHETLAYNYSKAEKLEWLDLEDEVLSEEDIARLLERPELTPEGLATEVGARFMERVPQTIEA